MTKEPLDKELYKILACPDCKGDLKYYKDYTGLYCRRCNFTFPIKEGIPILLPKEQQDL